MPITEAQRIERRGFIGSSDAYSIVTGHGIVDTYYAKVGPFLDDKETEYASAGNELEDYVLNRCERFLGLGPIDRGVRIVSPDGINAANLDGILHCADGVGGLIIEAKTCNVTNPSPDLKEFGDEGTDWVPARILIQVLHQFYCAGPEFKRALVGALLGGRGFVHYWIEPDEEIIRHISEKCIRFHFDHILQRVPPEGIPSMEILSRIERPKGKTIHIEDEMVRQWMVARDAANAWGKAKDAAQAAILYAMGDAEIAECSFAYLPYAPYKVEAYEVAAGERRALRFKKKKGGDDGEE